MSNSTKKEMELAERQFKKRAIKHLRRKFPYASTEEIATTVATVVPLIIRGIYLADSDAFDQVMELAYGPA